LHAGIGTAAYNRRKPVDSGIERTRTPTRQLDAALVVVDDGAGDSKLEMLFQKRVTVVAGIDPGLAWNRNHALFLSPPPPSCEVALLPEEDAQQPAAAGWQSQWIATPRRHGHVCCPSEWMREHGPATSGAADDLVGSRRVAARCAAYSHAARSERPDRFRLRGGAHPPSVANLPSGHGVSSRRLGFGRRFHKA